MNAHSGEGARVCTRITYTMERGWRHIEAFNSRDVNPVVTYAIGRLIEGCDTLCGHVYKSYTWPGLARLLAWELSSTPTCGQISQILVVGLLGVLRSIEIDSMIRLIDPW